VLALTAAAAVAIAVTDTFGGGGGSHAAVGHEAARSSLATVTRRALASHVNASGTLQYAAGRDGLPYTVVNHANGALTELPRAGEVFRQGQALYRVADKPVVLLTGSTPAYRSLAIGKTGPDVRQLNADLVALGYADRLRLDPTSDYFSAETAYALEKLQRKLGVSKTGKLELGQAVFLPSPLRITKVTATLGTSASAAPGSAGPGAQKTSGTSARRPEFVSLTTTTTATPTATTTTSTSTTTTTTAATPPAPKRPAGGKPAAGSPPPKPAKSSGHGRPGSGSHRPGRGRGAGAVPAQPILQASSTRREVVVNLDAADRSTVKVGQHVTVTLPDNRTTAGVLSRIGRVATSSGGRGAGSGSSTVTIPIYITLKHPEAAGSLDQAPVQVHITTATVTQTLAVPVTALVALADGRSAVRIVGKDGVQHLVPVTVGLVDDAQGLVQVKSSSLLDGQQVVVPGTSAT
jgi:hypothetical protein